MYCAVYSAIEQMEEDDEIDIGNIIKRMRGRRPELIQTFVSVKFIQILIRK